jgi:hypothetical protein
MMQLLSVACLSLAAKMEETEVPLLLDLQVNTLEMGCKFLLHSIDVIWREIVRWIHAKVLTSI